MYMFCILPEYCLSTILWKLKFVFWVNGMDMTKLVKIHIHWMQILIFKIPSNVNANSGIYFIIGKSECSVGQLNDCYNTLFPKVNEISVHISTV